MNKQPLVSYLSSKDPSAIDSSFSLCASALSDISKKSAAIASLICNGLFHLVSDDIDADGEKEKRRAGNILCSSAKIETENRVAVISAGFRFNSELEETALRKIAGLLLYIFEKCRRSRDAAVFLSEKPLLRGEVSERNIFL